MSSLSRKSRVGLGISYAALIAWPCFVIAIFAHLPQPARLGFLLTYSFALLPTYHLDHWLLGGTGFHSLLVFILFALIVALALWPFPTLSLAPSTWFSARWRRVFLGYAVLFGAGVLLAAWQMTKSWSLFFG